MTSILLNQKLELIALPATKSRGADFSDWVTVTELDGEISMRHASQTTLKIEQRDGNYINELPLSLHHFTDKSKALAFQINLDRKLIAVYLDRANSKMEEIINKNSRSEMIDRKSFARELKGTVFAGELHKDFKLKTYSILVAFHLADPFNFSINEIVSIGLGGVTSDRFKLNVGWSDQNVSDVGLKKLAPKKVYDFLWTRSDEISNAPASQFMRGLSYISQTFRYSDNPLVVLVWSIAAIEAMLSTPSDKANSALLESRLKALLSDQVQSEVIGKFRELYKYRNALLHGNVVLPYSFDDRNIFGFDNIKYSNTMPLEMASFTYALAVKILQRFIELDKYDLRYMISLAND